MLAMKVTCPHCSKRLKMSKPPVVGHRVLCTGCGRSFPVRPDDVKEAPPDPADDATLTAPPAAPQDTMPRPVAAPTLIRSATPRGPSAVIVASPRSLPTVETPPPSASRNVLWEVLVIGGLLLLMGGTITLVLYFATRAPSAAVPPAEETAAITPPSVEDSPPLAPASRDTARPTPPPLLDQPPPLLRPRTPQPPPEPSPKPSPPDADLRSGLPPEAQEKVNQAIDKGVHYLKESQGAEGTWARNRGFHHVGLAALPGLTLLECGVSRDDVRIRKAAEHVRGSISQLNHTYELALAILFLDRLGEAKDRPLIQTMALRLVAGQSPAGGWTYVCPLLPREVERNLLTVLQLGRPDSPLDLFTKGSGGSAPPGFLTKEPRPPLDKDLQGKTPAPKPAPGGSTIPLDKPRQPEAPAKKEPVDPKAYKRALNRLPPPLRELPALQPPEVSHHLPTTDHTDNSNTQFAILGLWAAGRQDLPLERSLALVVQRFRVSQASNGGWAYHYFVPGTASTPSMTGAGLLGLAVGHGLVAGKTKDVAGGLPRVEDPAIEKAFTHLGAFIGKPMGWKNIRTKNSNRNQINHYFLWTTERVGVLYNQRRIGGQDWYQWGAELLLEHQHADGSWTDGGYPGSMATTDTCFALLFLKRANLAKDLTKKLEFFIEGKKLSGSP
jgi:hypothetical protein